MVPVSFNVFELCRYYIALHWGQFLNQNEVYMRFHFTHLLAYLNSDFPLGLTLYFSFGTTAPKISRLSYSLEGPSTITKISARQRAQNAFSSSQKPIRLLLARLNAHLDLLWVSFSFSTKDIFQRLAHKKRGVAAKEVGWLPVQPWIRNFSPAQRTSK